MEATKGDFVIEQVMGRPQYSINNEQIDVTMKMLSPAIIAEDTGSLSIRKDQIEITFVNNKNPNGEVRGEWFDWPYFITAEDLGGNVDFSDSDYILEVLDKYKKKFTELKGMPPKNMDNYERYKAFTGHLFQDIEEKRKVEKREG